MSSVLFVSDIHLSPHDDRIHSAFVNFLRTAAQNCQELYILGDMFDFWIGDDDLDNPWISDVVDALCALDAENVRVSFMQGNRDYLLGEEFCRKTKMKLLADPLIVNLFNKRVLLSHGDLFCTLDRSYQIYRKVVHWRLVQSAYRQLPLKWRRRIANRVASELKRLRPEVSEAYLKKTDVVSDSIDEYLHNNPADLMIHGHTHRPRVHRHVCAGKTVERIVIGDWGNEKTVVSLNSNGYQRYTFELDSPANQAL